MQKKRFFKISLMMIIFMIIAGGCGGGGDGDSYSPQPTPPQPGSPTLSSLQISSGSLQPAFSPAITKYSVSVANNVTSVTATPATTSANALISVNGLNVVSGSASGAINLAVGSNSIAIIVGNSAGSTTYTVTATRASLPVYRKITAEAAYVMMMQSSGYILLDVRTEAEYIEERIVGAKLITYDEIEARAAAALPNKDQLIIVYCRSGTRSETAARALVALGYSNVYDFGGILDWKGKGYPTIGDSPPSWFDAADTSWWNAAQSSFTISTPEQLAGLARLVNQGITDFSGKTITLANNINLAGRKWELMAGYYFQGVFDGAGHMISNMNLFSELHEIGLFGVIGANGTVKNVKLTDVDIEVCPT